MKVKSESEVTQSCPTLSDPMDCSLPGSFIHGKEAFESVLMRWMNLEPIIQSEVSQKEKDKYCILMHIYGIYKNGTEEFIYRAAMEKQT